MAVTVGADSPPDRAVVCHAGQVVGFNLRRNVSDWSVCGLRKQDLLIPKVSRKDNFRPDPEVAASHRTVKSGYTRTRYDQGHLAPTAAMLRSFNAMNDSFFTSNIAPQVGLASTSTSGSHWPPVRTQPHAEPFLRPRRRRR